LLFFIRIKSKSIDLLKFPRKTEPPSYLIESFIVSQKKKIMKKMIYILFSQTTAALLPSKIQAFTEIKEFEL
jgi:hypothetical protein